MLSFDVAKLYKLESKRFNEVIKRNISKLSVDFYFQSTIEEIDELCLRSQFAILNINNN